MTQKLTERQQALKQEMAYLAAHPQYTALALQAINAWGREEGHLQYVVAVAIKEAYEAGRNGEPLPEPPAAPAPRMRRIRPVTPATPTTRVTRRRPK